MNDIIKILILEDDAEDRRAFQEYISTQNDITLTGCTGSATEALALTRQETPHAIIIDLELHDGDGNGLQFLSELKLLSLSVSPFLLITTNNSSHTIHEAARSLGADFILTKYQTGYSAAYVIDFLKMMYKTIHPDKEPYTTASVSASKPESPSESPVAETSASSEDSKTHVSVKDIPESELMAFVCEELNLLGISPKAVGFRYLADSVLIKLKDPYDNIYRFLGPKYKRSDPSIERSMQYAINRAWRTSNPLDMAQIYTARVHSERGVPTIMEFIFFLVTKTENHFKIKRL